MAVQYKVVITPDAQQAIQEITDYLLENHSVETAIKVTDQIAKMIDSLKTFPEGHDKAENLNKRGTIYRRLMAGSYRIIYAVNKDRIEVIIVDVHYGRRSQKHLIGKL